MEVIFYHKNLSSKEEALFSEYVNEKTDAIGSLLTTFADDARMLKATIEKFEKHDAYEVEFHLSLPNKTMVAKEASHNITKAVDLSKDRLVTQLKKHMALLRKERKHSSIRTPEKEKIEVGEFVME